MTDAVIVALITGATSLAGIIITTIASANSTRAKNKKDLEQAFAEFKAESDKADAEQRKDMADIREELHRHIEDEQLNQAKTRRMRVIRCADELSNGRQYGKDYIEDVLDDVDFYRSYCESHPEYHNGKGKAAMKLIETYYDSILKKGIYEHETE